jgi:hypothetical protein
MEQEYTVTEGTEIVDFGPIVDRVGFDGTCLHPTNSRAYQTPSGLLLMADGSVAEAATPPVPLISGFTQVLEQWGASGRLALEAAVGREQRLYGGSTHLSVEVEPQLNDELCLIYAETFAPALMLLMDQAESPGLLIRPRPSRTELCGEFVTGVRLRAALAFAAGSVMAIEAQLRGDTGAEALPEPVEVTTEPARRRHGWYVDRTAFGPDLYRHGRSAQLQLRSGGQVSAQAQLEACWEVARATLVTRGIDLPDLEAADDVVSGRIPLPSEQPKLVESIPAQVAHESGLHRRMLHPKAPPGLVVEPVSGTWDYTAFAIRADDDASVPGGETREERVAVVNVPERQLDRFLVQLEEGALDDLLTAYLDEAPTGRVLASSSQAASPGIFDSVNPNPQLLPPDRVGVGVGTVSAERPGKLEDEARLISMGEGGSKPFYMQPLAWVVGLVALLLVALVTQLGGGGSPSGPWSATDPRDDFVPSFPGGQSIENPSSAGDVTEMLVEVADGNTTVTVTFAGNAQGLMTEGGEELAAALQFIPVGDERFIDMLFNEDGSVKISDPPSGSRISYSWPSSNTLVFEITGLTPAKGATVRFATIQRLGFGHSTDEVLVSTGDEGSTLVTPEPVNAPPTRTARARVIQPCDVIDPATAASLAGTTTEPSRSGNDRRMSCDYPGPPGASEGTGIRLIMGVTRNTASGILRTYRSNNDGAIETRPVAWSNEGEMWIHVNGTAFSKVELLAFVDVPGPGPVYVTITMFGPAASAASMASSAETISALLNEAVLEAQP